MNRKCFGFHQTDNATQLSKQIGVHFGIKCMVEDAVNTDNTHMRYVMTEEKIEINAILLQRIEDFGSGYISARCGF